MLPERLASHTPKTVWIRALCQSRSMLQSSLIPCDLLFILVIVACILFHIWHNNCVEVSYEGYDDAHKLRNSLDALWSNYFVVLEISLKGKVP